ncbi:MAG: DegT/DnrJ/EryC1/StrS family aminotransferase [Phycisphaerae bacterium]
MKSKPRQSARSPAPRIRFVDLHRQHVELQQDIAAAVARVIAGDAFILGAEVAAFEEAFAAYCGAAHCVGVGSGLDALTLALRGLGIGQNDEVIIPANTFIATALSVLHTGATPVLVDYNPETYTLDPGCIRPAITSNTKAVIPVHLYGRPADMDRINAIAAEHDLLVIEDAAQAHGAVYKGRRCGSLARAAAFSFYPGKNLGALGDGGAVVTDDGELATWLRKARNYGSDVKHHHEIVGVNSRLDAVHAAVLRVKLEHLDRWNASRQAVAQRYHEMLPGTSLALPARAADGEHVYHLFVIQTPARDALAEQLAANGVETGIHYPIPIHRQPACGKLCRVPAPLQRTEQAAERLLSLPMHPHLTAVEAADVAEAVRTAADTMQHVV